MKSDSVIHFNNDIELLVDRITERILDSSKKYFHYYGENITKEKAIDILKTPIDE